MNGNAGQLLPSSAKPPDGQAELIESINDSTKHINTLTASFFLACIYIAISISSISHEELLLGKLVDLPLLNVKVPLVDFFRLAPLLIAFLHLSVLLQEYFLFCKLALLAKSSRDDGVASRFSPGLPVNSYLGQKYRSSVQLILRILRFSIYQILPLLLLCWIQARFLPYHGRGTTRWHQLLVILDILLILYYSRKLSSLRSFPPAKLKWIPFSVRTATLFISLSMVAIFSLLYAIVPGTSHEVLFGKPCPGVDRLLDRNLILQEKILVSEHPAPELLAARRVTKDKLDAAYLELARGIDLSGRDLRFADFTGSKLFNADFRGADLRGAILVHANLRGAKLMPTGGSDGVFELERSDYKRARISEVARQPSTYTPVRLEGANLSDADLKGVNLILANLTGARLDNAHLDGVELTEAKLVGADLHNTELLNAELSRSRLEFAKLVGAKLSGSHLSHAVLIGADLREAHLQGVDFAHAHLDGANLVEAHLEAADFRNATSTGAVFSKAWLQGATSLSLIKGVILRQARLQAVDFCESIKVKGPSLTDLRDVDFETPAEWTDVLARLPDNPRVLEASRRKHTCIQRRQAEDMAHSRLLYSEEPLKGPMTGWPPLTSQGRMPSGTWGEAEFLVDVATALWDDACNDSLLAQALAMRTLDSFSPADPMLNLHLACQYRERQEKSGCSGLDNIEESQKKRIIEIADRADSDSNSNFSCPPKK